MFVDVLAMCDACNTELKVVYALNALNLWPDADVIAFVFYAEVPELLYYGHCWLFLYWAAVVAQWGIVTGLCVALFSFLVIIPCGN